MATNPPARGVEAQMSSLAKSSTPVHRAILSLTSAVDSHQGRCDQALLRFCIHRMLHQGEGQARPRLPRLFLLRGTFVSIHSFLFELFPHISTYSHPEQFLLTDKTSLYINLLFSWFFIVWTSQRKIAIVRETKVREWRIATSHSVLSRSADLMCPRLLASPIYFTSLPSW